jgi:hypothetical protein
MVLWTAERHNLRFEFAGRRQILSSSLSLTKVSSEIMEKFFRISDKALSASFKTSKLTSQKITAHNIGEELILRTYKGIFSVIFLDTWF